MKVIRVDFGAGTQFLGLDPASSGATSNSFEDLAHVGAIGLALEPLAHVGAIWFSALVPSDEMKPSPEKLLAFSLWNCL
jgi:hypothetical protein